MPELNLNRFDLPGVDLPEVDLPELSIDDVTRTLKDAAYVVIGFGVLAAQKVQVQRREFTQQAEDFTKDLPEQLNAQIADVRDNLDKITSEATTRLEKLSGNFDDQIKSAEDRLAELEARIDEILEQLAARLPDQAAELVTQARDAARDAREQVRSLVGRAA